MDEPLSKDSQAWLFIGQGCLRNFKKSFSKNTDSYVLVHNYCVRISRSGAYSVCVYFVDIYLYVYAIGVYMCVYFLGGSDTASVLTTICIPCYWQLKYVTEKKMRDPHWSFNSLKQWWPNLDTEDWYCWGWEKIWMMYSFTRVELDWHWGDKKKAQ